MTCSQMAMHNRNGITHQPKCHMGIGGALMAQIAVNVGMNLRVLPVIGVTLPFYSAGGSSVLMLYICVGLVLSVYMHNTKSLFG